MEGMIEKLKAKILILILLVMGAASFNFLTEVFPMLYSQILLFVGLALYVLIYLKQAIELKDTLERRKSKIRHRSVLISILAIFAVLTANLIGFRTNQSFDVTATKAFTFSPYAKQVLQNLPRPVHMKVFMRQAQISEELEFYLNRFKEASETFTFEFVDPAREPKQAEQYGIKSQQNVAVLICGKRQERLYTFHERALVAALIQVQQEKPRRVYFTKGHGERSAEVLGRESYRTLWDRLIEENYQPETLLLAEAGKIPEEAEVLVIAGPVSEFLPEEVKAIEDYLNQGGRLLCLLDPAGAGNLADLLSQWGVRLGSGSIQDQSGAGRMLGAGPDIVFAVQYGLHPITENYAIATIFPLVRPVEASPAGKGSPTNFVLTSEKVQYKDPATHQEKGGPISVAVAVEGKGETASRSTRLVVYGDSDFASNLFLPKQGNLDLILNTFRWLSQDEIFIGQRAKDSKERIIRFDKRYFMHLFYVLLFLLPIASAGTGFYFWNRRRNLR